MIIVGVIGISLSSIFVRYSPSPSTVTATWRLLWTVLLMSPLVLGREASRQELTSAGIRTIFWCCMSGVFLAIHFALWFESLHHTTVASSTTIVCTEVIWVSLGYWIFLKGTLSKKALLAIAATFGGSILIAYADSSSGNHLYGDILALLAAIAVALYMLIGQVMRQSLTTTVYTYLVYLACSATLLTLCIIQQENLLSYGIAPVLIGVLLAVFSTILGHSVFSWCLKYFSPSFVSASKLCEPVVAAILAGILFSEVPSPLQILGGITILCGVYYYSKIEHPHQSN